MDLAYLMMIVSFSLVFGIPLFRWFYYKFVESLVNKGADRLRFFPFLHEKKVKTLSLCSEAKKRISERLSNASKRLSQRMSGSD